MIHHPLWVSPLFGLNPLSSIIWVMDGLALNTVQFGYPRPDILAVWIELLTLQQRIKDSEVGLGIDSRGGTKAPAAIVRGKVSVNQVLHKISLAHAPVNEEVFCEEGCHDHPAPIMHPPTAVQLAHGSVDDWIACPAFAPSFELVLIVFPVYVGVLELKGLVHAEKY